MYMTNILIRSSGTLSVFPQDCITRFNLQYGRQCYSPIHTVAISKRRKQMNCVTLHMYADKLFFVNY